MGEDIAQLGGICQCTAGLWAEFGGQRVIETPISEACIGAAAVGAAATGRVVPIVEVQLMDIYTQPSTCHAYTMHIPCIYRAYTMHIPCIYHAYTMHIPCICHASTRCSSWTW